MFSLQRLDLLFALVSVVCAATLWPDEVYINTILIDGQLGNDTPSCLEPWKGPLPCKSLSYALQGYRNDSTLYVLSHGRYTLNSSVMTFTNLNVIGISGNNSLVVCSDNAGLAFESVSYITITNVTFFSCGALRNSTSRNYSDSDVMTLSTFKVGLYFFLCGYVHLETMVVANSISATGVVMYDTTGYNEIISCEFYNNSVPDPSTSLLGGGGFYVEFTYCSPTGYCGNTVYNYNVGSTIIFYNCTFHNNVAMDAISLQSHSIPIIPSNGNHVAFGRGGGLSLFFNGNASHNTLSIINCNFSDNKALYGGGLFIEFHDTAVGNTVGVTGCLFLNNSAPFSGGGVRIGHFVLTNNGASYNNVTLHESDFSFNYGYYGGGLSIEPALQDTLNAYAVAYFLSQTCQFVGNVAMLGSAVYVSLFTLITTGLPPTIYFYHTLVQDNVLITSNPYNRYGAVHIHLVAVKFRDLIRFENNNGSALALVASHADFTSCRAEFFGNVGPNGAAIALLGAAWVIIGEDTIMRFVNNIATINGGAIYNMYIEKEKFSTSTNCFLKYRNATVSPENWTAHFTFINNSDSQGQNSIHSTSILPCGVLSSLTDPSKIFCWNNTYWNYSGSTCKEQISTDGSNVSMSSIPSFYPGQIAQLPLTVTDDLGNEVLNQTVFTGFINDTLTALSPQFTYIVSGYVQLTGNSDRNTTLFLNAAGNGDQLYSEFTIKVIECPPGLTPSPPGNKNATCVCDLNGNFGGLLLCLGAGQLQNNNTPPALLQQGNWIGIADSNSALLAGPCPPGYCDGANSNSLLGEYIRLPYMAQQLDDVICSGNRKGIMCGVCKDGYSPAINSYTFQCLPCNQSDITGNVFRYIGVTYVPLVAFFVMIILFKIRLTAGTANALILYSQVISSTFDLTVSESITRNIDYATKLTVSYRFVYGIFNLDFFSALLHPFCIANNLNTLDILSLNYVVALSPLVMIVFMLVCIKLLSNRCLLYCARCRISISPMMAFASFLLLSYNKLTLTSTLILSEDSLVTSNGVSSGYKRVYSAGQYSSTDNTFVTCYAIMAYVLLLMPILLLIVLFGYPVHFLERMVNKVPFLQKHYPADKMNIFLDTFQGDFKNNRRFYASFYFLFRLVVAVEYIVAVSGINQLSLQLGTCVIMIFISALLKPYKRPFLNYLDILMFANMAVLGSLSMYMLQNPSNKNLVPFILQYILIMTPAILYAGVYLAWIMGLSNVRNVLSSLHLGNSKRHTAVGAREKRSSPLSDEDVLIDRSRETNSYTYLYDSVSEKNTVDSGKTKEVYINS